MCKVIGIDFATTADKIKDAKRNYVLIGYVQLLSNGCIVVVPAPEMKRNERK